MDNFVHLKRDKPDVLMSVLIYSDIFVLIIDAFDNNIMRLTMT